MKGLLSIALAACLMASHKVEAMDGFIDWEKHEYDEEEYFKDIPDLINITETRLTFKIIHWFLTGVERGLYEDDTLTIDPDCFGDYYVTKLNEYEYLFTEQPFGDFFQNVIPEISITYQFYFMATNKCSINEVFNDYMVYCWYRGCWPQ